MLAYEQTFSMGNSVTLLREDGTTVDTDFWGHATVGLPSWSGDGTRAVGIGWDDDPVNPWDLFTAYLNPDQASASYPQVLIKDWTGNRWGEAPLWSPDNSLLLYAGCLPNDETKCGLITVQPNGSNVRLIYQGDNTYPIVNPDWSPDSKRIVFEVGYTGGTGLGIHSIGRDGKGLQRLTRGGYTPAYSPDGNYVAFSQQNGLYVMNVDGSNHRRIVEGGTNAGAGSYSAHHPDWQRTDKPVAPPPPHAPPTRPIVEPPINPPVSNPPPVVDRPSPPAPVVVIFPMPKNDPPATAPDQPAPRLSLAAAGAASKRALKREYGREYVKRRGFKQRCQRLAPNRASCSVRWLTRRYRYRGVMRITLIRDGNRTLSYYDDRVRRFKR